MMGSPQSRVLRPAMVHPSPCDGAHSLPHGCVLRMVGRYISMRGMLFPSGFLMQTQGPQGYLRSGDEGSRREGKDRLSFISTHKVPKTQSSPSSPGPLRTTYSTPSYIHVRWCASCIQFSSFCYFTFSAFLLFCHDSHAFFHLFSTFPFYCHTFLCIVAQCCAFPMPCRALLCFPMLLSQPSETVVARDWVRSI